MATPERQQQSADRDARVRDFIGRVAIAKAGAEYTGGSGAGFDFCSSAEMRLRGDEIFVIRGNVINRGGLPLEARCN
jgi:hypothetical protein